MNNSNKIYVTCLASKEIIQVNASTGLVEARIPVSKFPYAVLVDTSSIQVANFWKNTPEYLFQIDNRPHQFYLTDPILVEKNATSFTNTILVADVSDPTYASIPNLYNATIFKNGVDVGLRTTVVEGDQLKLRYTTPNSYSTRMEIPLYVGATNDWFIAETRPIDDILDPFYFNDVFDAELNSEYISNEIEITDIDVEVRLVFNIDYGTIILNGVDTGVSSTIVQLGDKIRIRAVSDTEHCGRKFISASCAGYTNVWSIINVKDLTKETKYLVGESNKSLFDFIDGSGKEAKNYVEKIVSDSVVTSFNLDSPPLSNGVTGDVFYVADYINSRIIKVDLLDGVEQVISTAPDKPYKVAWKDGNVFYSCPDTNKISNLDKSVVISATKPRNLIFNEYDELLVACDDGVVIYRKNTETLQYQFHGRVKTPNTSLCDLAVVSTGISQEKSCAQFTGTEYVNVSSHPSFNLGSDPWTFEAFVKIDSDQGNNRVVLFSNAGISGNQVNSNFSFYLEPFSIDPTNDKYRMACDLYYVENNRIVIGSTTSDDPSNFYSTGAKLTAIGDVELEADRWYHVVYTRSNVGTTQQLRFFVNGVPSTNIHINFSFVKQVYTSVTETAYGIRTLYNTNYSNSNGVLPKLQNLHTSDESLFSIKLSGIDPLVGKLRGSSTSFKGLLSNLRLTKGVAVYNSVFASQFFQLAVTSDTSLFMYPDNATTSQNFSQKTISTVPYDGAALVFNELEFKTEILLQDVFNLIYATDIRNNSVHEIEGYFHTDNAVKRSTTVHELPYSIAKDANNLYVANFGHSSISTINISAFTSTTTFLPSGFSFPIDIEVDGSKLYIAPYREPYLLEYQNEAFTDILLSGNPIAINKVNQSIWTTELYGEVLDNEDVGIEDFISPIVIPDRLNALFDTFYESDLQTISGQTVKPIALYLEPYSDATIIKNGIDVDKSTSFSVGDTFRIRSKSLSFFKKPKTVGLYSCRFQTSFTIITVADLQPDIMIFDPYMDAVLRSRIYTQELPITGIDSGEDLLIEILGYGDSINQVIEPQLIVNGEYTMSNTATVRLGDTIGFSVLVKGVTWNGDRLPVKIRTIAGFEFAFIDVYTGFLEGPIHDTKPRERKSEENEFEALITYPQIKDFDSYDPTVLPYTIAKVDVFGYDLSKDKTISVKQYGTQDVTVLHSLIKKDVLGYEAIPSQPNFNIISDYENKTSYSTAESSSSYEINDKTNIHHTQPQEYVYTIDKCRVIFDGTEYQVRSHHTTDKVDVSGYDVQYGKNISDKSVSYEKTPFFAGYDIDTIYTKLITNIRRLSVSDIEYEKSVSIKNVSYENEYRLLSKFYGVLVNSVAKVGEGYAYKYKTNLQYDKSNSIGNSSVDFFYSIIKQSRGSEKLFSVDVDVLPSKNRVIDLSTIIQPISERQVQANILPPYPSLDRIISPDTILYPVLSKILSSEIIHNICLDKVVIDAGALHNICLDKVVGGANALHNICLDKVVGGANALHNICLDKVVIEAGALHNICLDKVVGNEFATTKNLSKLVNSEFIQSSISVKIINPEILHNISLGKTVSPEVNVRNVSAKLVNPEILHNVYLTKNVENVSVHRINLSKIVSAEVNVRSVPAKLVSTETLHNVYLAKSVEPVVQINNNLHKEISRDVILSISSCKSIDVAAIHDVCLSKIVQARVSVHKHNDNWINHIPEYLGRADISLEKDSVVFHRTGIFGDLLSPLYVAKPVHFSGTMEYTVNTLTSTDSSNIFNTQEIRAFTTANEAIQYGQSKGFTGVKAYMLEDGSYTWYVPSKIINKYCTIGEKVYPVGWYVQGG